MNIYYNVYTTGVEKIIELYIFLKYSSIFYSKATYENTSFAAYFYSYLHKKILMR